jgi:hypothetical protein
VIVDRMSEVVVKNTYDEIEEESFGSLTVYKEVFGAEELMNCLTFVITVEGPEDFSDTKTIADGESYTWDTPETRYLHCHRRHRCAWVQAGV